MLFLRNNHVRMFRLLFTALCCFIFSGTNAQWQALNGPRGTGIGSLYTDDQVIYAGGQFQSGEFYLSTDLGDHWAPIRNGLPDNEEIGGITVSDSLIFAVTGTGKLYKANISDYQWSAAGQGLPGNTQVRLTLVHDSILFLSTNQGLFRSWDAGNNWHPGSDGISETCLTTLTETGNRIFAGTCYGEIYYSENNGESWVAYNTSTLPEIPVYALLELDSVMVVGSQESIYRTEDRGNSWIMVTNDTTAYDITDFAIDSDFIYASTFGQGILRSQDHGISWVPVGTGLLFQVVYDLEPGNGFLMAGTMGGVFKSFNQGNTWSMHNEGLRNTPVNDVVNAGDTLFAATYLGVSRSADNGTTWDLVLTDFENQQPGYVNCLHYSNSVLYAGYFCNGFGCSGIFMSADGGDSWQQINNGLFYSDVTVIASKGPILFAGTYRGLFRSGNKGNNWNLLFDDQCIYDIACTGDSVFIACYSGVYCSADNGDHWTQVNTGLDNPWFFSLCSNGSKLFGGAASVYRSAICPVGWQKINSGIAYPATVHALTADSSMVFFGDWQGVYVTTNNGEEWFLSGSGFPEFVFVNALTVKDSFLFAGTHYGIWKRPLSEMFVMEASPDTAILEFEQLSETRLFIHSNVQWSLEGTFPDWLSADAVSGTGSDTVTFIALSTNEGEFLRSASFQLVSSQAPALRVDVIQQPFEGSLAVSKDSLVLDWDAGSKDTLAIFSTTSWSVGGAIPAWFELSSPSGVGNSTVVFTSLESNLAEKSRSVELEINAFQASSLAIRVTQKRHPAGIWELQKETVKVYPVPSDGTFCLESLIPIMKVTVLGSDGTLLETRAGDPLKGKELFFTSRKGVLIIKVQTEHQNFTRKVVIY